MERERAVLSFQVFKLQNRLAASHLWLSTSRLSATDTKKHPGLLNDKITTMERRAVTNMKMEKLLATYWPGYLGSETIELLNQYLNLLLKWNARTNLTAIRSPEEIVTRHFGESLAISSLLGAKFDLVGKALLDLGSGAGFPGVPVAMTQPRLKVTLIESQSKKAAFLKELVRELGIINCSVFAGRAENIGIQTDFVTMRAVDRAESMISVAYSLLVPRGTLAIMLGVTQSSPDLSLFDEVREAEAANQVRVLLATKRQ